MLTVRVTRIIFGLFFSGVGAFSQVASEAAVRRVLADRFGSKDLGVGMVVGIIDADGRRVVSFGSLAKNDERRLGGDTVFEIGSMTKVFTSLLLMDMVRRGEVALADPVSKYLPQGIDVPERNGRKITLADLSTQSSGLPGLPTNFAPTDESNPFADYSIKQLYNFLAGYQLTRDPGSRYEYSNVGAGLLGHALSLRAGLSFESLVHSRILAPLGMADTCITLTPEMNARLAVGHSPSLGPVPNWDLPTLPGAGALRSTANDMLTFLAANLGLLQTRLSQAMTDQVSIRRPALGPGVQIAYGWHIQNRNGRFIISHGGGTGGFRSYMAYDPTARTGVVVLANVSFAGGPNDIGPHLLDASYPLPRFDPPFERKAIKMDAELFDRYVGTYQLGPSELITVSRRGERFYTQLPGRPNFLVFAEADRKFFFNLVDAQLTFDLEHAGLTEMASTVTLHEHGKDRVAKRLSESELKRAMDGSRSHNTDVQKP